jgi:hypothetical protein
MNLSAKTAGKHLITLREGFSLRAYSPAEKNPHVSLIPPVFSGPACGWAFVAAKFRLVQYLADIFKLPPGTHSPKFRV